MLEIKNIVKSYKRGNKTFNAVDDISLSIDKGDFIHIIGRSGSGKSTLLNIVAGLLSPDSGEVILEKENYIYFDDEKKSRFRNKRIGFIPQSPALLSYFNVLENIVLPYYLYEDETDIYGKARYILNKLGIEHLAESYPSELSGGETRKCIIARALINDPEIIIADEPTSDLDIESTNEVLELLSKINEMGTTLLVVTHELDTLKYGKKVYTMEGGKLREGKYI